MRRVLATGLAKFVHLHASLEFLFVLFRLMIDLMTDRTFKIDTVVLRHTTRTLNKKFSGARERN